MRDPARATVVPGVAVVAERRRQLTHENDTEGEASRRRGQGRNVPLRQRNQPGDQECREREKRHVVPRSHEVECDEIEDQVRRRPQHGEREERPMRSCTAADPDRQAEKRCDEQRRRSIRSWPLGEALERRHGELPGGSDAGETSHVREAGVYRPHPDLAGSYTLHLKPQELCEDAVAHEDRPCKAGGRRDETRQCQVPQAPPRARVHEAQRRRDDHHEARGFDEQRGHERYPARVRRPPAASAKEADGCEEREGERRRFGDGLQSAHLRR